MPTPVPAPAEVHVWRADLNVDPDVLDVLYAIMSGPERTRAARFRSPAHTRAYVAARGILRCILAGYVGENAGSLRFGQGEHGKPFLLDHPGLRFNVSHSGSLALCAVSGEGDVGVDVEQVRTGVDHEALARRFFCPSEYVGLANGMRLAASTAADHRRAFFALWAAKEAYVKATGAGLSQGLKGFELPVPVPPIPPGIGVDGWWVGSLDVGEHCTAALAADCPVDQISWRKWTGSDAIFGSDAVIGL